MDRIPSQPDLARPAPFAGARPAAQDWAATPFGPVESWPQSLRTAASMVLGSTLPMFLGWGPDFLLLYNDAYAEILGDRGPAMGGRSARSGRTPGTGSSPMPSARWPARRSSSNPSRARCGAAGARSRSG